MHRFFTNDIAGDTARISGDDLHHLRSVLRLRAGDAVSVCDGSGTDYDGLLQSVSEAEAVAALSSPRPSPSEPPVCVTLFQGLPKAGKMETIVQKCVELGIRSIVPTRTARCVAVPARDFEKKRVRYQRVANEAAKQSRRGVLPTVENVAALETLDLSGFDTVLFAYENEWERTLKSALRERNPGGNIAFIIGPEGGFAPEEAELLKARGAISVSLGRRILRTETAGPALLACLLYEVE